MSDNRAGNHKLVLGTVQFGLDYGISNAGGRPAMEAVRRILDLAKAVGIDTLDTAAVYGNSEEVLGLLASVSDFGVITKTLPIPAGTLDESSISRVSDVFDRSLSRLRRDAVEGVLVHQAADLLKPGADLLYALLSEWKVAGRTARIGVSVYDPQEADEILRRYPIDLIQLPFNVVDQRALHAGALARLRDAGVEVHARSAFLQGALLMAPEALPDHLAKLRPLVLNLREECEKRGWSVQEACLRFVAGTAGVDGVVCGVNSPQELEELAMRFRADRGGLDFSCYALDDSRIINPSEWPKSPS